MSRFKLCVTLAASLLGSALLLSPAAQAGGGYFVLGYGPYAGQVAGTSTAVGFDTFFGASNPAKLSAVGDRVDLGVLLFAPYRRATRSGSGTDYDFSSKSRNDFFVIPDGGYASKINENWAWGVTVYANGGLNTEYHETTGVAGSNLNPALCGDRPGNFLGGCGEVGFDLTQLIIAPTLSYRVDAVHSFGISPLLAYQQLRVYGLQAFAPLSRFPDDVTNNGYEKAFGAGVRVGWLGQVRPWLDLGAAYSTRVYMEDFDEYRGLFAGGNFDIPAMFSLGLALKDENLTLAVDLQRIYFGSIPALGNGVLDTLTDPQGKPLGSKNGSGFNWRNQTNYRVGLTWHTTPRLDLRAGFAYGRKTQADDSADTGGFSALAPNPALNMTAGFSYRWTQATELHASYGRYMRGSYRGDSVPGIFPGGTDGVEPHVDTIYLGWSRRW
ncbi:long-chain fatty acid transport protein [Panacagrimonas perspica]|uniref:Long-chain fatty acid transport protein n=1 Tax=Panacagrimonas perspica TaxID=381431 RepID=A0A4R7P6C6_9GAMM|nr:outer membrane protein transport protein [Panacagrimonas perspica]TDU28999.1 long-chain fatty acid transport protein [Panacagrimonas perspica]THD02184.1 hypothetical protein B1810_14715 [Panacagrimonas perspica]